MHALNPVRRVGDQIAEAIQLHDKVGDKQAAAKVGELLEQVGLLARHAGRPTTCTSCRAASASG